jgi:Transcriptional regulatory protein, C terminal
MTEDFQICDVHASPARGTLRRGNRVVTVQPRVMDVLCALRTGVVVSRQTLEATVWQDTHVSYHAIPRAVSQLRGALAKVECDGIEVVALSKRGYMLRVLPPPSVIPTAPVDAPLGSLMVGAVLLVAVGLAMHALDAHGSPVHLALASAVLVGGVARMARSQNVVQQGRVNHGQSPRL